MTALGLLIAGLGVALIWAGVKGEDIRALIAGVIRGTR